MINGIHIKDSIRTVFTTIFYLGYFSINLELNHWLIGPTNPEIELNNPIIKLLELIATAKGVI